MAVETAPASAAQSRVPPDDEQVHSGLFWLAIIAVIVGSILLGVSRVWTRSAPNWVKYPTTDQTTVAEGQFTVYVDPTTGLPLDAPRSQPLRVTQRVATIGDSDTIAVVAQHTRENVGTNQHAFVDQVYAIDLKSVKNVKSDRSWAFSASNLTDRSSAYSVNLPFDTGRGPYAMWMDEVGSSYAVTQQGPPFTQDGVGVIRLKGHVEGVPAVPAYITQLKPVGIPGSLTLSQVATALTRAGVDFDRLMRALQPKLSGGERAIVDGPINLDYTISGDTSILVEPHSGTIVSVEGADRTLSAKLDEAGSAALETILTNHGDVPGAMQAAAVLTELASAPTSKIANEHYAQTPASVKDTAGYAARLRDDINKVRNVIPNALLGGGVALLTVGVIAGVLAWRRRKWPVAE